MRNLKRSLALGLAAFVIGVGSAEAANIKVTITNNAPSGGTYLTPAWVGFHDGSFDVFSTGAGASAGLEALAEDGSNGPLSNLFSGSGVDGTVGGGPLAPGMTASQIFNVANDGSNHYFSYAAMILPSNDFFIGNGDPLMTSIAGLLDGTLSDVTLTVVRAYDAGTEVNDFAFSAANGLFGIPGGQAGPNQGTDENSVVTAIAFPSDPYAAFANALGTDLSGLNFTEYGSLATISLTAVPVPAALPLLLSALGGLGVMRKRANG